MRRVESSHRTSSRRAIDLFGETHYGAMRWSTITKYVDGPPAHHRCGVRRGKLAEVPKGEREYQAHGESVAVGQQRRQRRASRVGTHLSAGTKVNMEVTVMPEKHAR